MKKLLFCIFASLIILPTSAFAGGTTNTTIKYIDLGLPSGTLWANTNVSKHMSFFEAQEYHYLPSQAQFQELITFCEYTWTGKGLCFTGPNGNSITFYAMGIIYPNADNGDKVYKMGKIGYYWTKENIDTSAFAFCFDENHTDIAEFSAYHLMSVRLAY